MTNNTGNIQYSANGKIYAGMTKESIRANINAMSFESVDEREKAYNKQIELFNYANSLVEGEVDDVISEKELEAYNKKEKTKKIWKAVGLAALGIGIAATLGILAVKFGKTQKSPEYAISKELDQRLAASGKKQVFQDSFNEFFQKKHLKIKHNSVPIIKEGDMLHGMNYSSETTHSVLKSGIVSGEVGFEGKEFFDFDRNIVLKGKNAIVPEDCETFGCADFFTSPKEMSIKEYFSTFVNRITGNRQAPERTFLPRVIPKFAGSGSRKIAFIVDAEKMKSIFPVLSQNSATPSTLASSSLEGIISQFAENRDNLKSVLVGVPSNCISKIVVGTGLKPEEIIDIKNMIKKMKLDIKIYDVLGALL